MFFCFVNLSFQSQITNKTEKILVKMEHLKLKNIEKIKSKLEEIEKTTNDKYHIEAVEKVFLLIEKKLLKLNIINLEKDESFIVNTIDSLKFLVFCIRDRLMPIEVYNKFIKAIIEIIELREFIAQYLFTQQVIIAINRICVSIFTSKGYCTKFDIIDLFFKTFFLIIKYKTNHPTKDKNIFYEMFLDQISYSIFTNSRYGLNGFFDLCDILHEKDEKIKENNQLPVKQEDNVYYFKYCGVNFDCCESGKGYIHYPLEIIANKREDIENLVLIILNLLFIKNKLNNFDIKENIDEVIICILDNLIYQKKIPESFGVIDPFHRPVDPLPVNKVLDLLNDTKLSSTSFEVSEEIRKKIDPKKDFLSNEDEIEIICQFHNKINFSIKKFLSYKKEETES
jgi:hypothetical protein